MNRIKAHRPPQSFRPFGNTVLFLYTLLSACSAVVPPNQEQPVRAEDPFRGIEDAIAARGSQIRRDDLGFNQKGCVYNSAH